MAQCQVDNVLAKQPALSTGRADKGLDRLSLRPKLEEPAEPAHKNA